MARSLLFVSSMDLHFAGSTHIGRRANNEDALCTEPQLGLFVVADGMGGYEGGEIASQLAVGGVRDFLAANARDPEGTWPHRALPSLDHQQNLLRAAVAVAHRQILGRRTGKLDRMGSTIVAALVRGASVVVAHVGDSRCYRLRHGQVQPLTRDHSYWAELQASGADVARADFPWKNQITRALGIDGASEPDVATHSLEPGDALLLCTDGLYDPLDDHTLASGLSRPPAEACAFLTQASLAAGTSDNLTAVVLRAAQPLDM